MSHGRLLPTGADQTGAVVAGSEPAEREILWTEMVDARIEAGQIAADQIEIDVLKRPGAGGGPEERLASRVTPFLGDPGRKQEKASQGFKVGDPARGRSGPGAGEGRQGAHFGRREIRRKRDGVQPRINLEGQRLVFPVEGMGVRPDALCGVFGPLVIISSDLRIPIVHGFSRDGRPHPGARAVVDPVRTGPNPREFSLRFRSRFRCPRDGPRSTRRRTARAG